jgi:hypothetical protein
MDTLRQNKTPKMIQPTLSRVKIRIRAIYRNGGADAIGPQEVLKFKLRHYLRSQQIERGKRGSRLHTISP